MKFCYTYDNMERLLTATVERDGTGPVLLCGNTLDELSLSHDGNQLRRVTDQCAGLAYEGAMDYRGDVRAVVADDGTLEEVNHYYPYGMLHGPSAIAAGVQPCKYTGKELDREAGLDLYDFAARQLDPALGRTTTQNPMAEKYYSISPYAWCASNPIRNVDPTGNFLLENMDIENYNYPLVAVFFSNRDKVLEDDYMAAKNANVPIMVVDNMGGDFTNAMSCFTNMLGCSTDIYTINSHGSPGALSVPNEDNSDFVNMDFTSDFTALKDGLSDKIVFIGACNVGEGFTGSTFTQLMSLQTNSTVITSEQPIKAGYKYDGGPDLVPSSFQFYNHYKMSEKGLLPSKITDVKMDKNRGITWRENYFWSKPYNSDNKVSTLWFQQ